jgi:hypothetical protein
MFHDPANTLSRYLGIPAVATPSFEKFPESPFFHFRPPTIVMEQDQTLSEKPGHPPVQAILHEVRTAENSAAYLLPKLQSIKESNPHLTLLDVGAGSGTISVSFAKLIPR